MLLLPIFLCLVLFSRNSTSFDENAKLVDAVVATLTAASRGSADVLLALSSLGQEAAVFLKVVVPIGGILAKTANPKPQSEEYKALMDLKTRTEEIWRDIERRIEISTRAIDATIAMSEYSANVKLPIVNMKKLTDEYINPKMYKSDEFISDYKEACIFGKNAPQSILEFLHLRLVKGCYDAVTQSEAQELADHRAYLMRVFLRLRVDNEPIPDPGLYLSEFLVIYEQIGIRTSLLNEDLKVFRRYFSSYRKAVQAFFEELRDRASIAKVENYENSCVLRALIETSNFNYPAIQAFAVELKNQLIDLTFIAGICANVTYHGHAKSIEIYTKEIADSVTLISSYSSKWLNDSLISAWPSAHNEILREQITRIVPTPGYVDNTNLKVVADLTHPLLINTGLPNHVYEMLIVRAVEEEYELYFEGVGNNCSLNKGAFGFDTIIGRIPLNSTNEQDKFEVDERMLRLSNDAVDLNVTIQHEMNELYDASTLPPIADTLKKKIVYEFITPQNFHCWGIVREWSPEFWNPCPTIDYWSSPHSFVDLRSITTLSYTNRGTLFQDCEAFRFFFFV